MKELHELRGVLRLPQFRHRTLFNLPNPLLAYPQYLANVAQVQRLLALQAVTHPQYLPLTNVEVPEDLVEPPLKTALIETVADTFLVRIGNPFGQRSRSISHGGFLER